MIRWRSGKDVVFEDRAVGDRDRVVLLRHRSLADRLERDHRVVVADRRLWSPSAPGAAILRDLILMVSTRSSSQNATDGILKIPEFRRFQRACKGTKCRIFSRSYNAICCTLLLVRSCSKRRGSAAPIGCYPDTPRGLGALIHEMLSEHRVTASSTPPNTSSNVSAVTAC